MNENQGLPTLTQTLAVLEQNEGATAMDLFRLVKKCWPDITADHIANQLRIAANNGLAGVEHGSNAWKIIKQDVVCTV